MLEHMSLPTTRVRRRARERASYLYLHSPVLSVPRVFEWIDPDVTMLLVDMYPTR